MFPHAVTDDNPNEHYGVRACTFAGQSKSPDCGGRWFSFGTQHVRVANPLAPHVSVCQKHLAAALAELEPPKPARKTKPKPAPLAELSL